MHAAGDDELLDPPARSSPRRSAYAVGAKKAIMMSTTSSELKESGVSQITARLPDTVVEALDAAAKALHRSRADVIRQAVERYLEDFDDLSVALERLRDPADPVLDWENVRDELLGSDQVERRQGPLSHTGS